MKLDGNIRLWYVHWRIRDVLDQFLKFKREINSRYIKNIININIKRTISYIFFYSRNLLNKLDKQLQRLLHHTQQLLIILDTINIKIIKIIKFHKHFILIYYYISNYHNYIYLIL